MSASYLSTGQAARLCSVTPDTVLKWIHSGRLQARRTAGGHNRIERGELERLLSIASSRPAPAKTVAAADRAFLFCWEYYGKGRPTSNCVSCPVYQARALRCYEVVKLLGQGRGPRAFCRRGCTACDYYLKMHRQPLNVLVVTDDQELVRKLKQEAQPSDFRLAYADCEYTCSMMVHDFRPDYAVVDCSLGKGKSREITEHLLLDPRAPSVRVILAGRGDEFPADCDRKVFARMVRPFGIGDIQQCIRSASAEIERNRGEKIYRRKGGRQKVFKTQ